MEIMIGYMKFARYVFFAFLLSLGTAANGQDIHFTNYDFAPLNFNPGLTGSFSGSVRLGGIYRDQSRAFFKEAYSTNMFYVDSPIAKGLADNHWIGAGFIFYGDKSGLFGYKMSGMIGSAAYHIGFDKEFKNVLTFGLQYGGEGIKVDEEAMGTFDDNAFLPGMQSVDASLFRDFEASASDANFGILFKSRPNKTSNFETGVAMYRILNKEFRSSGGNNSPNPNPNPNPNPTTLQQNKFGQQIKAHARYRFLATDRIAVIPAVYAALQKNLTNISVQGRAEVLLNPDFILRVGVGYRVSDALELIVGAQYKDWNFGVSYDLTTSSASTFNNSFGAIEVGAYKIFNIYKRPNPDEIFFCPKF